MASITLLRLSAVPTQFQARDLILGGELNLLAHPVMDRSSRRGGIPRASQVKHQAELSWMLESHALVDLWRALNPTARQYTFYSHKHHTHTRIDYLLCSKALFNFCDLTDIGQKLISDHVWVTDTFPLHPSDGRGANWHLNRVLIRDELYKPEIENEIRNFPPINSDCGVATPTVCDAFKATLWEQLISMATTCKKERDRITAEIKGKIGRLEAKHVKFGSKNTLCKLQIARKKLELVKTSKIQQDLLFLTQKYVTRSLRYIRWLNWKVKKQLAARYFAEVYFLLHPGDIFQGHLGRDCFLLLLTISFLKPIWGGDSTIF